MNEWIDLSVRIDQNTNVYPGDEKLEVRKTKNLTADGYNLNQLNLNMHIGTHIDFRSHVSAKDDEINFNDFMGKANVIKPRVIDNIVSTQDLAEKYLKQKYQEKIIILNLNHGYKFNSKSYFDQPLFEPNLFSFLKENNILILAADIPSFNYINESNLRMHCELLKAGMYLIENLTNLDELSNHVYFIALPLNINSIEASMVRAIAKNL